MTSINWFHPVEAKIGETAVDIMVRTPSHLEAIRLQSIYVRSLAVSAAYDAQKEAFFAVAREIDPTFGAASPEEKAIIEAANATRTLPTVEEMGDIVDRLEATEKAMLARMDAQENIQRTLQLSIGSYIEDIRNKAGDQVSISVGIDVKKTFTELNDREKTAFFNQLFHLLVGPVYEALGRGATAEEMGK